MGVIGWLIIGLLAGALARFLVPGRDPMGWVATLALGLVGSLVGGLVARSLGDSDGVGLLGSTLGAVAVLLLWKTFVERRRRGVRGMARRMTS